ncbi:hypothetical protein [Longirhabdus pacifica]|uniref:hypothetical protein n=1 Tax=Longirhabdus pacifica TaxID=2305227 RepID=UPI001008BE2C|nr:hypothetical protein [Longirhabdus pacifica]
MGHAKRLDFKRLIKVLQSEFKAVEMDHTKDEYILDRNILLEDDEAERHSVHKDYKYMKCFKIEDTVVLNDLFTAKEKAEHEEIKKSDEYESDILYTRVGKIKRNLSSGEMILIFFGSDDGEYVDNMTTQGDSNILLSKLSKVKK